jgi:hypothetical protein
MEWHIGGLNWPFDYGIELDPSNPWSVALLFALLVYFCFDVLYWHPDPP